MQSFGAAAGFFSGGGVSDHGLLIPASLLDDDHPQYLLLAGRAGGQVANGGTAAGDDLTLRGSTNADMGTVIFESPAEITVDWTPSGAVYWLRDASNWGTYAPAFIGGCFADQKALTHTNTTFIYECLRGAPTITKQANDGFAAFTLFQGLPLLASGTGAGHNPLNPQVLNASPTLQHLNTGTRTVTNYLAVSVAGQLNTRASNGQTLNATNWVGLSMSPRWNTNAGTTVSFGTVRGVWCQLPAVALFGSSAGVETMGAYYGIDYEDMATFGGNVPKAAVYCKQSAASNAYCIRHTGTAQSVFGGNIRFPADLTGITVGASDDLSIAWGGGINALYFQFNTFSSNQLRFSTDGSYNFQITNQNFGIGVNTLSYLFDTVRYTRRVEFQGVTNRSEITAVLAADDDDSTIMGVGIFQRSVVQVTASGADRTITGFDISGGDTGDEMWVVNEGTNNVILAHENAGSLAANRMISPTGADITLATDQAARLWYSNNDSRWRILYTSGT